MGKINGIEKIGNTLPGTSGTGKATDDAHTAKFSIIPHAIPSGSRGVVNGQTRYTIRGEASVLPMYTPSSSSSGRGSASELCCDKCDGKHETNACPYYKKERGTHPDAKKITGKSLVVPRCFQMPCFAM